MFAPKQICGNKFAFLWKLIFKCVHLISERDKLTLWPCASNFRTESHVHSETLLGGSVSWPASFRDRWRRQVRRDRSHWQTTEVFRLKQNASMVWNNLYQIIEGLSTQTCFNLVLKKSFLGLNTKKIITCRQGHHKESEHSALCLEEVAKGETTVMPVPTSRSEQALVAICFHSLQYLHKMTRQGFQSGEPQYCDIILLVRQVRDPNETDDGGSAELQLTPVGNNARSWSWRSLVLVKIERCRPVQQFIDFPVVQCVGAKLVRCRHHSRRCTINHLFHVAVDHFRFQHAHFVPERKTQIQSFEKEQSLVLNAEYLSTCGRLSTYVFFIHSIFFSFFLRSISSFLFVCNSNISKCTSCDVRVSVVSMI